MEGRTIPCRECLQPCSQVCIDKRDGKPKCSDCVRRGVLNQAGVFVVSAAQQVKTYNCQRCSGVMAGGQRGVRDGARAHLECAPGVLQPEVGGKRLLVAKYDSVCSVCTQAVRAGSDIIAPSYMGWVHEGCAWDLPPLPHMQRMLQAAGDAGLHDWQDLTQLSSLEQKHRLSPSRPTSAAAASVAAARQRPDPAATLTGALSSLNLTSTPHAVSRQLAARSSSNSGSTVPTTISIATASRYSGIMNSRSSVSSWRGSGSGSVIASASSGRSGRAQDAATEGTSQSASNLRPRWRWQVEADATQSVGGCAADKE